MNKIIPTLPTQGSQRNINLAGSNPVGGINLPPAAQPGWPSHDAAAANGQRAGVPQVEVAAPKNEIPGKPMHNPADAAPTTLQVAGREGAPDRESN